MNNGQKASIKNGLIHFLGIFDRNFIYFMVSAMIATCPKIYANVVYFQQTGKSPDPKEYIFSQFILAAFIFSFARSEIITRKAYICYYKCEEKITIDV